MKVLRKKIKNDGLELVEQRHGLRRGEPFAERGELAQVRKQHRHLALLAGGETETGVLDMCGHLRREIPAQTFAVKNLSGQDVEQLDAAAAWTMSRSWIR